MESAFQKITLYDILGYLLPGSAFLMLVLFGMEKDELLADLGKWADDKWVLYFAFFVAAYFVGIVLSEVMRWICTIIRKVYRKKSETSLPAEKIADALIKSGISGTKGEIEREVKEDLNKYYMQYMYGIVQKSKDNKRIHNYASAYVLYKNASGALFLSALYLYFFGRSSVKELYIACICMSVVFLIRSIRFEQKKDNYAIIWFVEQYLCDAHT